MKQVKVLLTAKTRCDESWRNRVFPLQTVCGFMLKKQAFPQNLLIIQIKVLLKGKRGEKVFFFLHVLSMNL